MFSRWIPNSNFVAILNYLSPNDTIFRYGPY